MLLLFESASGYAIFKVVNEKKLQKADDLFENFETAEKASKIVKLKHFEKFNDMTEALSAATAAVEGKMSKKLKSVLKKVVATEAHEQLAVADAKLGNTIKEKLNLSCVTSTAIQELMRCIRGQIENLLEGFPEKEMAAMSLGLAHSLSRYKLKFSPDKVDTMIIQAVSLLDDLDKELNNYVMRCKEWYGWHFPELSKLITDNTTYIKTVLAIGMRSNAASANLDDVVPEELQGKLRELAEISIGTEISEEDIFNILQLGREVLEMQEYRAKLYEYLKNRMMAIAPNLTVLVGDLVGARLISHAGSLLSLAKHPASTVQILGAEKALFRALKTKHDTPKYGLIYHAQLVGMSNSRIKGKVSRMLAAKAALACRVDALGEDVNQDLGIEHRAKLEARLKFLEEGGMRRLSGSGKGRGKFDRYEHKSRVHTFEDRHDVTIGKKRKFDPEGAAGESPMPKKIKAEPIEEQAAGDSSALMEASEAPEGMGSEKKKKKKKIKQEPEEAQEPEETMQVPAPEEAGEEVKSEKKKKKKKKSKDQDEEDE